MKETLSYKDKDFLKALKEAGEKAGLIFDKEIKYNDKTKMYTISYIFNSNDFKTGGGFGGDGGGSW